MTSNNKEKRIMNLSFPSSDGSTVSVVPDAAADKAGTDGRLVAEPIIKKLAGMAAERLANPIWGNQYG